MTPIPLSQIEKPEDTKKYDDDFKASLLKDIPYFHMLYAKYHDQKWLELAQTVGTVAKKLSPPRP